MAATLAVAAAFAVAMIATPAASAHGPGTNGCTWAPDSGPWWNFHAACDRHDRCYDQLWFGKGPWIRGIGWRGRLRCDNLWRHEMYISCGARYSSTNWRIRRCYDVADTYYSVVRRLGAPYFDNPNLN